MDRCWRRSHPCPSRVGPRLYGSPRGPRALMPSSQRFPFFVPARLSGPRPAPRLMRPSQERAERCFAADMEAGKLAVSRDDPSVHGGTHSELARRASALTEAALTAAAAGILEEGVGSPRGAGPCVSECAALPHVLGEPPRPLLSHPLVSPASHCSRLPRAGWPRRWPALPGTCGWTAGGREGLCVGLSLIHTGE